jgi:hypothetical protein
MYRITDPERSREFYETLGFEYRRELPIVRDASSRRPTTSSVCPARRRSWS